MTHRAWIVVPLLLASAACADVTTPDSHTPESAVPRKLNSIGWDIVAQVGIPAYETCGHFAMYDGNGVSSVDWAVNGAPVALDAGGINVQNNGYPYSVSVGYYNGGWFSEYYSETFWPEYYGGGAPPPACLTV